MPFTHERRFAPRTNHLLAARVAAELEESVEHARGIQVFATKDWITLRGVALRDELGQVIKAVKSVAGVRGLTNDLDLRTSPGNVFALQN